MVSSSGNTGTGKIRFRWQQRWLGWRVGFFEGEVGESDVLVGVAQRPLRHPGQRAANPPRLSLGA